MRKKSRDDSAGSGRVLSYRARDNSVFIMTSVRRGIPRCRGRTGGVDYAFPSRDVLRLATDTLSHISTGLTKSTLSALNDVNTDITT